MPSRYEDFLAEVGGLRTSRIVFRRGAPFTNPFGLTRRYRTSPQGASEWGWPGIHFGVDRSLPDSGDPKILAPIRAYGKFEDWKGEVYGTLIFLRHWAGFEIAIGHCHPSTVSEAVKRGARIRQGDRIASAGDYGFSFGVHTHTEIRADGSGNPILDEFAQEKIGSDAFRDLSTEEVVVAYKKCEKTAAWTEPEILEDYYQLRRDKGVEQMNRYRMVRRTDEWRRTYYSSQLVLDF